MNKRWTEHFKADLPTFYDATRKFYAKELKPAEYKGISGGFGCYGERGGETTMIRLRFTGGILEREDLIQLREAIKKYNLKILFILQHVNLYNFIISRKIKYSV